jgi:hypothetical protein
MKITTLWLAILLVSLTGCVTSQPHATPAPPKKLDPPESVVVYYYVKPGLEGALEDTLARAWALYQKENMVAAQPHLIVKETENQGNGDLMTRYIEIFTWLSHAKPAHAPDAVSKIWQEMQSLCQPHNGRQGPYGGEVEVVNPVVHPAKP